MYVALSDVKNIKNLHLIKACNSNAFQVNSNVTFECNRFRDNSYFIPSSTLKVNSSSLTVSLLNTRPLRRHLQDISKDKNLMENDLLRLIEIQFCLENDISNIKDKLDTFEVHLNLEGDRYQNIGFCLSRSIKVSKHEKFPGVSVLEIVKDSVCSFTPRILLLYRSLSSSLSIFYNSLETFLSTYKMFDIILGNFNINVVANNNIQQVMSQYQLITYEPTHISRSILDHVYINRQKLQKFSIKAIPTVSVYFSDHQAVKFKLRSI